MPTDAAFLHDKETAETVHILSGWAYKSNSQEQRAMEAIATTTLNDIIGENIRMFRKSQRMTQQKLARAIYANQDMVCNWELGNHAPSAYYLIRLADAFGCSVDEILGRK